MKDYTHELARQIVELYLQAKGREILAQNLFKFSDEFIKGNKLEKRYQGHSYDILTPYEIVEVDDYQKHSKKNQKINDGIAEEFARTVLKDWSFYRLLKEEIVNSRGQIVPDCASYLRKNLF